MGDSRTRSSIVGRYVTITVDDRSSDVFYETSGTGPTLLCLHTAGADSRQYHDLLTDPAVTRHWRVVAFDLPWHGRSEPPDGWHCEEYLLTTDRYVKTIEAVIDGLALTDVVVLGCSMGGSIVLELARRRSRAVRAVIGLQGAARVHGRFLDWSVRPDLNGSEYAANWVWGLMAPQGPESGRRRLWWIYNQGGAGVYRGDTHFYAHDWDLRGAEGEIDTSQCRVFLLSGSYDYACPPASTRETAGRIAGAQFTEMQDLGHFPMIENYEAFRTHLMPILAQLEGSGDRSAAG